MGERHAPSRNGEVRGHTTNSDSAHRLDYGLLRRSASSTQRSDRRSDHGSDPVHPTANATAPGPLPRRRSRRCAARDRFRPGRWREGGLALAIDAGERLSIGLDEHGEGQQRRGVEQSWPDPRVGRGRQRSWTCRMPPRAGTVGCPGLTQDRVSCSCVAGRSVDPDEYASGGERAELHALRRGRSRAGLCRGRRRIRIRPMDRWPAQARSLRRRQAIRSTALADRSVSLSSMCAP
jgi:hypothetical protein